MAKGLSELQRWVITRAYRHYCEDRELVWAEFVYEKATPDKAEFFAAVLNSKMSAATSVLRGGERRPASATDHLPTPKPGIAHILLPQVVGHIAGVEGRSSRERHDGYSDYFNNFCISDEPKQKWIHGADITRATYNAAYASASRCVKRLKERGLLQQHDRNKLWLSLAGINAATELTGITAPVRGWDFYAVKKTDTGWNIEYEPEQAYWLNDKNAA